MEMSAETEVVERLGGGGWDMVFEGEGGWKVWKRGEEGIVVRAWNGENGGDQEEAGEGLGDWDLGLDVVTGAVRMAIEQ